MKKLYLHQFLSGSGFFESKKSVYDAIRNGEVSVDGRVVRNRLFQVKPCKSIVSWKGRKIAFAGGKTYIVLNKPAGFLSSRLAGKDLEKGKKSVFSLLSGIDEKTRNSLFCVGRLDEDTSGLLLLTNDGVLCSRITNPKYGVEKSYSVVLEKPVSRREARKIEKGVVIDLEEDGRLSNHRTKACKIAVDSGDCRRLEITLSEGRKREVKRMFQSIGSRVVRLKRISIGGLKLAGLGIKEGSYLILEKDFILRAVGFDKP
ncbi:MAG: rRNA pseudouridine synthase [Candidatus Altiarchaeales archaeon]|nr:rRNA pseudouridine synthase [Candidatus Altiarchaeales archaeon]